jgi:hypothetical protein
MSQETHDHDYIENRLEVCLFESGNIDRLRLESQPIYH